MAEALRAGRAEDGGMSSSLILLAVPVFFALIGVELWLCRRRGRRDYRFSDALANLSCGVGQQTIVTLVSVGLLVYVFLFERAAPVRLPPGAVSTWLACFVAVDFCYYWAHRASHRVNFLWAAHAVHHQSEDYNLSVALRQSWAQRAFFWPFFWPLALLGFPPAVLVTTYTLNTLYQFWIHTQLVGRLGPLEWVLNTPSHHRVHHGVDAAYLDRNHGGMLIVWDRLFGTFRAEGALPRYGVVQPLGSFSALRANLDPWRKLARMAAAEPRLSGKLLVFLRPPDWRSEASPPEEGPLRTDPGYVLHDVERPPSARALAAALFLAALVGAIAFLSAAPDLAAGPLWAGAAVLLAALTGVGALLDGRASPEPARPEVTSAGSPKGLPISPA
ncbi:sterol desaturase family protein [Sorangium sp. So ce1389]|uniref:sterol desaturase family protein n=1 Tax=Sorangium sp. So ce1389 TaxID=3133336 RepID=UPI003F647199